jgi:MEMO1 family protein
MHLDRPLLRPYLQCVDSRKHPHHFFLVDRLGLAGPMPLTQAEFAWVERFDGVHTVADIQREAMRQGQLVPLHQLQQLVQRLDEGLLLETPRFQQMVNAPDRPPRCIGVYEAEADSLRRQLHNLFARGAGIPARTRPDGSLRAALVPHIDYERGGLSYTYAFKEVFEKSDASLFVIIGTSHHSAHRFTLTRKNFQTPLGIAQTDQDYVGRLAHRLGNAVFADEWLAHFPEHSIELEVVFLQYLYEKVRPIRIVPLVVGSFHDCVLARQSPARHADIASLIDALRAAEAQSTESICYIISGDLAHIGPRFDPTHRLDDALLEKSARQDRLLLRHVEAVDMSGYFGLIASEMDERNICGLPPTFAAVEALQPRSGKVLCYDRYVHPEGHESVSFASAAFYR